MKVALLVATLDRPDLIQQLATWIQRNVHVDCDLVVVDSGSSVPHRFPYTTVRFPDDGRKGEVLAQNVALEHAREQGRFGLPYDAYVLVRSDVTFDEDSDAIAALTTALAADPTAALIGATPHTRPQPSTLTSPRITALPDARAFAIRATAVEQVGFLNPEIRLSLGAMHELVHHLHLAGWRTLEHPGVRFRAADSSPYAAAASPTTSAAELTRRTRRFAYAYLTRVYGADWPQRFAAAARAIGATNDPFAADQRVWAGEFTLDELASLAATRPMFVPTTPTAPTANLSTPTPPSPPPHTTELLAVRLGAPRGDRQGWVTVSRDRTTSPDIAGEASDLAMLRDGSCRVLDARGALAALEGTAASRALDEWTRVLAPTGELWLDRTDLARLTTRATASPTTPTPASPHPAPWRAVLDPTRHAVLAWPRYDDPAALDRFLGTFGRVVSGRRDSYLVLRVDPALDPAPEAVVAALAASHARVLGESAALDVELLDGALSPDDWLALGAEVACIAEVPSPSRALTGLARAHVAAEPGALASCLARRRVERDGRALDAAPTLIPSRAPGHTSPPRTLGLDALAG